MTDSEARRPAGGGQTALLAVLVSMGAVSTSAYVPSLPDLARELGTDAAGAQLTITLFLAAFATGQLVYGPLSDAVGRRPALLAGLAIYCLGTIACAVAPTIDVLIAARFVQGLGACSGPVVARAVVRDRYGPVGAAAVMATLSAALALAPAVGPTLGGLLHVWLGWRANFDILILFGVGLLAVLFWRLEESNRSPVAGAAHPAALLVTYARLLRDPVYMRHVGAVSLIYGGMFAYLTAAPFLFITILHLSPPEFGLTSLVNLVGYLIGTLASRRLAGRASLGRLVLIGGAVGALSGLLLLALAATHSLSVPGVLVAMVLYQLAIGLVMPNGTTGAIERHPRAAGYASAFLGFAHVTAGGLGSLAVASFGDPGQLVMSVLLAAAGLGTLALAVGLVRRG